ncbi:MarR family winged helix-turn-helix transcriptional regulator [Acidipropionibacterium virtanenii]|uniref:Transcriptional activatory protein BadR n=1 Tax=Acidipropionibacterium virtanenii TaxID=2057246 RepID=A0A344UUB0_9ACTN|nr:MarR family transcriptional regulator [Acidipropionibacterium virtanenii]AXE38858.1 Transcriptional activatory protein BadR [Acidipropionibacterium virtanenii]
MGRREEPGRDQRRAWIALAAVAELLPQVVGTGATAGAGLTSFEYMLLGALRSSGTSLRTGELAAALDCPAPRVSKTVARLERRNLVRRSSVDSDRRATRVSLTDQGRRTHEVAVPEYTDFVFGSVLKGLGPDELDEMAGLLEKVLENLNALSEEAAGPVPSDSVSP